MSTQEMLAFVVECLSSVYSEQGMAIQNTNKSLGSDYPNFVMESKNGKKYFVLVDVFTFPTPKSRFDQKALTEFRRIAIEAKALPAIAPVGLFCFETNGAPAICGGSFAMKYDTLQAIDNPKTFWGKLF